MAIKRMLLEGTLFEQIGYQPVMVPEDSQNVSIFDLPHSSANESEIANQTLPSNDALQQVEEFSYLEDTSSVPGTSQSQAVLDVGIEIPEENFDITKFIIDDDLTQKSVTNGQITHVFQETIPYHTPQKAGPKNFPNSHKTISYKTLSTENSILPSACLPQTSVSREMSTKQEINVCVGTTLIKPRQIKACVKKIDLKAQRYVVDEGLTGEEDNAVEKNDNNSNSDSCDEFTENSDSDDEFTESSDGDSDNGIGTESNNEDEEQAEKEDSDGNIDVETVPENDGCPIIEAQDSDSLLLQFEATESDYTLNNKNEKCVTVNGSSGSNSIFSADVIKTEADSYLDDFTPLSRWPATIDDSFDVFEPPRSSILPLKDKQVTQGAVNGNNCDLFGEFVGDCNIRTHPVNDLFPDDIYTPFGLSDCTDIEMNETKPILDQNNFIDTKTGFGNLSEIKVDSSGIRSQVSVNINSIKCEDNQNTLIINPKIENNESMEINETSQLIEHKKIRIKVEKITETKTLRNKFDHKNILKKCAILTELPQKKDTEEKKRKLKEHISQTAKQQFELKVTSNDKMQKVVNKKPEKTALEEKQHQKSAVVEKLTKNPTADIRKSQKSSLADKKPQNSSDQLNPKRSLTASQTSKLNSPVSVSNGETIKSKLTSQLPTVRILKDCDIPLEVIARIGREANKRKAIPLIPPIPNVKRKCRGQEVVPQPIKMQPQKAIVTTVDHPAPAAVSTTSILLDHTYAATSGAHRQMEVKIKKEQTVETIKPAEEPIVIQNQPTIKNIDGTLMVSLLKNNTIHTLEATQKKKLNLEEYKRRRYLNTKLNGSPSGSACNSSCNSASNSPKHSPHDEVIKKIKHVQKMHKMAEAILTATPKSSVKPETTSVKTEIPKPVPLPRVPLVLIPQQKPKNVESIVLLSIGVNTDPIVGPVDGLQEVAPLLKTGRFDNNSLLVSIVENQVKTQKSSPSSGNKEKSSSEHGEDKTIMHLPKNRPAVSRHHASCQTTLTLIAQLKQMKKIPGSRQGSKSPVTRRMSQVKSHSRSHSQSEDYSSSPRSDSVSYRCSRSRESSISNSRYRRSSNHRRRRNNSSSSSSSTTTCRRYNRSSRYSYSRSRSRSSPRSRSRSPHSLSRSPLHSRSRQHSPSYRRRFRSPISRVRSRRSDDPEFRQEVEQRRVIYVGNVHRDTKEVDLRQRFERFGTIKRIDLHLYSAAKPDDMYGYVFLTYYEHAAAVGAIEQGNEGYAVKYDIGFGGRRVFCNGPYSDLDNMREEVEYPPKILRNDDTEDYMQMLAKFMQERNRKT